MTRLLEEMLEKASKLKEAEQNALASIMLEEMEDEERWEIAFANSQDALSGLAEEASTEFHKAKKD